VDFHSQGMNVHRLPPEIESTLYRISREALTNVFRHAKATRVSILVERRAEQVSLIVEDDGQGFDAGATLGASATEGKLGLLGMQERATLAGGSLEIESSPGAGTTVFVRLPLDHTR
jgi:signal transduction histidine kinase